jgi:hypothetical protein
LAESPHAHEIGAQVEAAMADANRALGWISANRSQPAGAPPAAQQGAGPSGAAPPMVPARISQLLVNSELFSLAELLAIARHSAGSLLLPLESALQVLRAQPGSASMPRQPSAAPDALRAPGAAAGAPLTSSRQAASALPAGGRHGAHPPEGHAADASTAAGGAGEELSAQVSAALRAAESALRGSGIDDDGSSDDGDDARGDDEIAEAEIQAVLAECSRA